MLDIKIGYTCNNNCVFCAVKDYEQKDRTLEEFNEIIVRERINNNDITITGGEVTTRDDFFKILGRAHELEYNINIQSNGRMFSNIEFAQITSFFNISEFLISIHGHNAKIHELLTQTRNSFNQTVFGIENLVLLDNKVVTNTVLMKENIDYMKDLCVLLNSLNINEILLSYPDITGGSLKNIDKIPTLLEIRDKIPEIVNVCDKLGMKVIFDNIPLCIMGEYSDYVSEKNPINLYLLDTKIDNFIPNIITDKCIQCKLVNICCHPQQIYIDKFGDKEFDVVV